MWRLIMIDAAVGAVIGWLFAALTGEPKLWAIAWAVAGACVALEIQRRHCRRAGKVPKKPEAQS
jgi:uncharacterized membrane protein YoaK (UPF0700 family)